MCEGKAGLSRHSTNSHLVNNLCFVVVDSNFSSLRLQFRTLMERQSKTNLVLTNSLRF